MDVIIVDYVLVSDRPAYILRMSYSLAVLLPWLVSTLSGLVVLVAGKLFLL